jgi:hypothetical protein
MGSKKKKLKKVNLLEMTDVEKIKFVRRIRESLQQKALEAKIWQSFAEVDSLSINGKTVHCQNTSPKGFSLPDVLRNV